MPTLFLPNESRRPFFQGKDGRWTAVKDIDSVIEYTIDWSAVLDGDEIDDSVWETELYGVTNDGDSFDDTTTTITVSGTNGWMKNTITTINGLTHVKHFAFVDESQLPDDYRRY